jgi:cell wall-associated NlpC family hydrolase
VAGHATPDHTPQSRSARAGRWPHRPLLVASLAVLAALTPVLLGTGPAAADPTVEEIEAQIDAAWRQLEPAIEKHNATRIELADKKRQAKKLEEKIAPLQETVDEALHQVGDIAAKAYMTGNFSAVNALVSSGSPTTFADRLVLLDQFARSQQDEIAQVIEVKAEYEERKAELDALVAELTEVEAEQAEKTGEIDAEIDRLQELRLEAYGSTGGGTGDLRPAACPATYPGGAAGEAITFACEQIGKPYIWAAEGPDGYDCSGLTLAAWSQAGVSLPHNAAQQRATIEYVDRDELVPGDLVFYYGDLSHVGMYAGDGWIVHASRSGVPVQMQTLDHASIHSYGRPG